MAASERSGRSLHALGRRLLAAAILVPIVIFVTLRGGWLFTGLVTIWSLRLLYEYDGMAKDRGHHHLFATLAPMLLITMLAAKIWGPRVCFAVFTFFGLYLFAFEAARGRITGATAHVAEKLLAIFYLGLLPAHWILLRELPREFGLPVELYISGGRLALYGAGITWLGDTFAYFIGSLFGRHRLGTAVSPKKSVEGAIGGLLGAVLVSWLLAPYWARYLGIGEIILVGILLSVAGQLGDLFESLLKRDAAIKDSSGVIPGHGGFLDRVDSLLFTYPVLYYIMLFYKSRGGAIF